MAKQRGIHQVGRRLFLTGAAGTVVALPLLEAFFPRRAKPQDMTFRYAVFMRQGNGVQQGLGGNTPEPDRFWPKKLGALTTAGMRADGDQAVNVLADYAAKLLIVRGCNMVDQGGSDAGCGHSEGALLCLTAQGADGPNVQNALATGESIDNRIVSELSGPGVEPLTLRAGPRSGYLDDVLSYRGAGDRRVATSNPYEVYNQLFPMGDVDEAQRLALRRKSVNDLVRGEMSALLASSRLSKEDRDRLEQHRQAIRDLEVGMQCNLPAEIQAQLSQLNQQGGSEADDTVQLTAQLHAKVIALAVACGRSHAITLQIGCGNDQTQYTINGQKYERFHHISHRINSDGAEGTPIANADMKHHDIDKLFAGMFLDLVRALDERTTPTGTLLDEGVAVWLNDLSNGPPHSRDNMPYVCAGSCGGQLKTGAYVDAGGVTHNKFLNTIGAAVGCKNAAGGPLDDFGHASLQKGRISQMLA